MNDEGRGDNIVELGLKIRVWSHILLSLGRILQIIKDEYYVSIECHR